MTRDTTRFWVILVLLLAFLTTLAVSQDKEEEEEEHMHGPDVDGLEIVKEDLFEDEVALEKDEARTFSTEAPYLVVEGDEVAGTREVEEEVQEELIPSDQQEEQQEEVVDEALVLEDKEEDLIESEEQQELGQELESQHHEQEEQAKQEHEREEQQEEVADEALELEEKEKTIQGQEEERQEEVADGALVLEKDQEVESKQHEEEEETTQEQEEELAEPEQKREGEKESIFPDTISADQEGELPEDNWDWISAFVWDKLPEELKRRYKFYEVYKTNHWRSVETRSGFGSTINFTAHLRSFLSDVRLPPSLSLFRFPFLV